MPANFLDISQCVVSRGGRTVLDGLTLGVRRGEVLGLLGPNGAGKTTLLSVVTGLLQPQSGSLALEGRVIDPGDRRLRACTGVVFQQPAVDTRLTARQNLRLAATLHAVPRRLAAERIEVLLERAGLTQRADDRVETYSGGMRRRVEIARALLHRPAFLVLDEPSAGLDEGAYRRMWRDLLLARKDEGLTLLLTTHRGDEAELCDRIGIIDSGKLVACDAPEMLRRRVSGDLVVLETAELDTVRERVRTTLGVELEVVDGRLHLQRESVHELIPRLIEAAPAGSLRSVTLRRTGMGEVFLALTGHELDGARKVGDVA